MTPMEPPRQNLLDELREGEDSPFISEDAFRLCRLVLHDTKERYRDAEELVPRFEAQLVKVQVGFIKGMLVLTEPRAASAGSEEADCPDLSAKELDGKLATLRLLLEYLFTVTNVHDKFLENMSGMLAFYGERYEASSARSQISELLPRFLRAL